MPDESILREVKGFLRCGKTFNLGVTKLTDEEATEMLGIAALAYQHAAPAYVQVGGAVFDVQAFIGFQITPPPPVE